MSNNRPIDISSGVMYVGVEQFHSNHMHRGHLAMAAPLRQILHSAKPSPRIRQAAMLYASGAVPTKGEAARLAGISREHFVNMTNMNPATHRIMSDMQSLIEDETVATSKILQQLSRKAVGRLATLMNSDNEAIAFRAAQDLADRGPETQKTQRVQVDSLTLTGSDAKELAAAMVESARLHEAYKDVGVNGLVEIDTDKRAESATLKLVEDTTDA